MPTLNPIFFPAEVCTGIDHMSSSSNVYRAFRQINLLSRVFGVMPLKMAPGDQATGPVCQMSVPDYVYTLVLLVMSLLHGLMAPFYVLNSIMPDDNDHVVFSALMEIMRPHQINGTRPHESGLNGSGDGDDDVIEISVMATVMKILNPIMITVSCVCSRLVALSFLHRRFDEFITVLHNTDRLMTGMTVGSPHVTDNGHNGSGSLVQFLDKYLL